MTFYYQFVYFVFILFLPRALTLDKSQFEIQF